MDSSLPRSGREQKLKNRRKSRRGCGNCKLRKVKCDEGKPECQRCLAYGVFCNYDDRYSDLQLSDGGAKILEGFPQPMYVTIPNVVAPTLRQQSAQGQEIIAPYQLNDRDLQLLGKFQGRTCFTISIGKRLQIFQDEMIRMACSHPYLMHSVLALTMMHDRYLSPLERPLSAAEAFHWYNGVALFKAKLSGPVQPSERDPLWAASMFLGIISFSHLEAEKPEEAWPLRPASATDLSWLKMSDGKKALWRVVGAPATDSLFETPFPEDIKTLIPSVGPGLKGLPPEFIKLYDLEITSAEDENPYRAAAVGLAQSLYGDSILVTILGFLSFIGSMPPDYKRLLEQKDHRALLLMAYWFAQICHVPLWWMSRRATSEGRAICIYLERHHGHEADIKKLLQFPKMSFGEFYA